MVKVFVMVIFMLLVIDMGNMIMVMVMLTVMVTVMFSLMVIGMFMVTVTSVSWLCSSSWSFSWLLASLCWLE